MIFGVKLWDTEAAAAAIRPLVGEHTAVLSLQNGVVKDDILRRVLGDRAVVGGVGYIAATIAEPGVIRHTGTMQKLVFGEYDGHASERLLRFRRRLCRRRHRPRAQRPTSAARCGRNSSSWSASRAPRPTARAPIGPIRSHPQSRAFLHDLVAETVAGGARRGRARCRPTTRTTASPSATSCRRP